ncbi:hypothetical protein [Mesorhizobium sp. M1A.F.Ca.IN.022.06.1.1]|uniref:hypothetical protein n=1 Tax=Mesorhizobium sp. M1A.F.Ca.IN.022.06.1.1 TaxID=2493680 RepID=UPI001FE10D74|nr:hypothetical protein [Mesorhizobium sp. M1A.F.Ca.IN.022.06.1.1]
MPTSDNPPLAATLRLFSLVVIIVLTVGAGLFFAPVLVKPRWPWAVTPFNARFLGGFYTAEMVVMAALLFWNRWSPGRLVLVMALIFTVIVSVASFINLGYFNFGRKAPWLWFLVYLGSVAVSGLFLWRARARPSAKGVTLRPAWRGYMPVESAVLGLYGVGLLLFPLTFGSFWPWPVDGFHAQVYSAIFLAGRAAYMSSGEARGARNCWCWAWRSCWLACLPLLDSSSPTLPCTGSTGRRSGHRAGLPFSPGSASAASSNSSPPLGILARNRHHRF